MRDDDLRWWIRVVVVFGLRSALNAQAGACVGRGKCSQRNARILIFRARSHVAHVVIIVAFVCVMHWHLFAFGVIGYQ